MFLPGESEGQGSLVGCLLWVGTESDTTEVIQQQQYSIVYMYHNLYFYSSSSGHVQAGFRKGRGTRDQIANIRWILEKAREFQKNIYFYFIDNTKAFDCVDQNKL